MEFAAPVVNPSDCPIRRHLVMLSHIMDPEGLAIDSTGAAIIGSFMILEFLILTSIEFDLYYDFV